MFGESRKCYGINKRNDRKRLLALLASDPLKRPLVLLAARDDADGVRALLTRGADVNGIATRTDAEPRAGPRRGRGAGKDGARREGS